MGQALRKFGVRRKNNESSKEKAKYAI